MRKAFEVNLYISTDGGEIEIAAAGQGSCITQTIMDIGSRKEQIDEAFQELRRSFNALRNGNGHKELELKVI